MKRLLQHLLAERANQFPNAIAVSMGECELSYEELEIQSNKLAYTLAEVGCQRGDRVCLLMPNSPDAIVSMFGILKADCIYVPLDHTRSVENISKEINECNPRGFLMAGNMEERFAKVMKYVDVPQEPFLGWMGPEPGTGADDFDGKIGAEFNSAQLDSVSAKAPGYKNSSEDIAQIIFSHKEEGKACGVATTHESILSFIGWAKSYFSIQRDDHLSNYAPLHSGISELDIYGAIASGAQLHMVPDELRDSPYKIADFISRNKISHWFSTPGILTDIAEYDLIKEGSFTSLKHVLWSRGVFPTFALRYWMKRLSEVSFTNLYGHKETTVASSYYTVPEIPESDDAEIPIGEACAGEGLYILDSQLNPVPENKAGELFISGVGLSNGYWEDKTHTEKSFLFNPYVLDGDRTFYKTGDHAYMNGGEIYYCQNGSADKINNKNKNGMSTDLAKIENAINDLKLTLECAVVSVSEHAGNESVICCAFVPSGTRNNHIAGAYLRQKLEGLLPDHLIPKRWNSYVILPKKQDGEVDRNKISRRFQSRKISADA